MAKLIFRTGQFAGKSIGLPAGRTLVLGRNRDIDLPLPDLKLSRRHCEIGNVNGRSFVKDLNSTNGTFVNNERLPGGQPRDLRARDRVVLGDTEIEFEADAEEMLITGPDQDLSNMATPQPGAWPAGMGELLANAGPAPSPAPQPVPIAAAPISQVPAHMYGGVGGGDPRVAQFQAALQEVLRPLPVEPPPLPGAANAGNRPKYIFCDGCNGSIPLLDLDLGTAKEVEGKMICKDCLQRGVHISVVRPAAHPQQQLVTGASTYRPQPAQAQAAKMDSMLAGLDQDAEMVDTTIKRRGVELRESDVMESMDHFEKTTGAAGGRVGGGAVADHKARPAATQTPPTAPLQAAKPAPPPPPPANDELGEEFEEIG